jgi:rod shape-determining protein MreC
MLQPPNPARRGLAFILALLLCVALSVLHRQSIKARGSDTVTGTVRDLGLVPAQGLTTQLGHWWHDTITACFQGPVLARRNQDLAAQVHALLVQNQNLNLAQAENVRLRALLGFQQKSPLPLLAAEVVAIDPSAQTDTLILARGTADGVRPRAVALAPNGALVGPVLDVSSHSCSVLMLTDSACSVGAQVVRRAAPPVLLFSSRAAKTISVRNGPVGICQGDRAGHMTLTYLPAVADVRVGDLVTTSGLGGIYPKGIPIGTVEVVTADKARSVKTARLRPAVDLDHLEQAFLRIKPTPAIALPADPVSLSPPDPNANMQARP